MKNILNISVPNLERSKLFVTSVVLNATGAGLVMAFMMLYFSKTTTISLSVIGLSIAVGRGLSSIVPLFIGRLLDAIGPRKISILGDFISGIGFILCIFARDPVTIMLTQFFTQAGSHIFWTCSRGLVTLASKNEGTHTWFGLISSIRNVGLGLGTLVSSLAFTDGSVESLHYLILASAFLYFFSCIALYIWQPEESLEKAQDHNNESKNKSKLKEVWADHNYRGLLVINFGLVLSVMVIPLVIVLYATEQLGLPPLFSGGLVILNTVIVAMFSTHVASWSKSDDPLLNIRRAYFLNICSFALFWGAAFISSNYIVVCSMLVVAMIIFSIAEMLSTPATNVLSIQLAPSQNSGNYMAAFQMTWSIGMTFTPALFGWLMDINRHSTWSVLVIATLILAFYGFRTFKRGVYEYSN